MSSATTTKSADAAGPESAAIPQVGELIAVSFSTAALNPGLFIGQVLRHLPDGAFVVELQNADWIPQESILKLEGDAWDDLSFNQPIDSLSFPLSPEQQALYDEWRQLPLLRQPDETPANAEESSITPALTESAVEALLAASTSSIEPGLKLVRRQCKVPPIGVIDLLCRDSKGCYVVVELKSAGAPTTSVVQQTLQYMGWVRAKYPDKPVRGIIVVAEADAKLKSAVSAVENLKLKTFRVTLQDV